MYQENPNVNLSHLGDDKEKEFNALYEQFLKETNSSTNLTIDTKEYDMKKLYSPTHACIWNKPKNIGKESIIVQKNDKVALLIFKDDFEITLDKFYRLEDISKIN